MSPAADNGDIGVDVAGYLRGGLGLGEAARRYVTALEAAGIPVRTTTVDVFLPDDQYERRKVTEFEDLGTEHDVPFNLVCVNAPELPNFYTEVGPGFFAGKRTIGVWAWEVDRVPSDWAWAFGVVDEIWTYSQYVVDLLRPASDVPVARVPLPVVEPPTPGPPPDFGLPDRFTFLFLFDFYSTMQRKNPLGLIEAFSRAFSPGEGPQLVLKSFNGDLKPQRLAQVSEAAARHPDIHVIDRYVTAGERDALVAGCDCFVSLHRAEGFGLGLAEAMAFGRPVIATGFSGNVDFMTPENSWLVRNTMTRVGRQGENYPSEGQWAEPDVAHAAQLMREVWENPEATRERAERGRRDVLERLSPAKVGALARERLERLAAEPPREEPPPPPPAEITWAPLRLARGKLDFDPLRDAKEAGGVTGAMRQAALRAMRPYTHHQEELNWALVEAVSDLARRFADAGLDVHGRAHARRLVEAARARPAPAHPLISRDEAGQRVLAFTADPAEADAGDSAGGFGDIFRGDEETVRRGQEEYVALFEGTDWVLDIGCGRGEFLDLLRDRGQTVRGVDQDEAMVARCRAKGHEVEHQDALAYLGGLEDGSLPAAFAAQVIEHLPAGVLNDFLAVLAAKLRPGGVAVLETVNPHQPSALKAFWVDPTHHHPLFPEVTLALARFAGFREGRVMFPGGAGDFGFDLYTSPDYALVLHC